MNTGKRFRKKQCKLHFKHLNLPKDNLFHHEIALVLQDIYVHWDGKYQPQKKIVEGTAITARAIIEGLYQVYGCRNAQMSLSLPTSQHAYGRLPHQIPNHTYTTVKRVLDALDRLRWIIRKKGFKNSLGEGVPTTIVATGDLLSNFERQKFIWRFMSPSTRDVIVLKGYDPNSHAKEIMQFKDNNFTRAARKNLQKINTFITEHAICLALDNWDLDHLIGTMSNQKYQPDWSYDSIDKKPRSLNFLHTQMRRIFARGSFKRGGRFFGGWWQYIPSEYRPFITINGEPTCEVDYSELHPRLLYWEAGLPLPPGDLYDLGLRYPGFPYYDKTQEPYKAKRKVIKAYINALLNDEKGTFALNSHQIKTLGMNTAQLHELVINKHPLIKDAAGKGLYYQFLDSQLAERVMLDLLSKHILCLPIHDSFICQVQHVEALKSAMLKAYQTLFTNLPALKDPEPPQTQFKPVHYPSGELDETYMENQRRSSVHAIFVNSFAEKFFQKKRSAPKLRGHVLGRPPL